MIQTNEHSGADRFLALLSYLGTFPFLVIPLFIVPLLVKRDNIWIRKHARQGLVVYLAVLIIWWIPLIGWVIALFYIILSIIVMVKVLQGTHYWKMPIVGTIAEKLHI